MKWRSVAKIIWHKLWRNYNISLRDSCLDEQMKEKLQGKVMYHENKLKSLL